MIFIRERKRKRKRVCATQKSAKKQSKKKTKDTNIIFRNKLRPIYAVTAPMTIVDSRLDYRFIPNYYC